MTTEIRLHFHDLDAELIPEAEVLRTLSPSERVRASRFRDPRHGRHFRNRRYILRSILADEMACFPWEIDFAFGDRGKPEVMGGPAFSCSHSDQWLLIGMAPHGRLGVDVEVPRPSADYASVARHMLAAEEVSALAGVPDEAHDAAFLRVWTRKEAFIKALGEGLSLSLRDFVVAVDERPGNALLGACANVCDSTRWLVCSVANELGLFAAVAIDAHDVRMTLVETGCSMDRGARQCSESDDCAMPSVAPTELNR